MATELEDLLRSMSASEREVVEAAAISVLSAVKAAGVVSLMPSPALPTNGILLMVHPKVYDRVRALSKENAE